jgi:hypothetical protein
MLSQVKDAFSPFSCHTLEILLTDPFPENLVAPSPLQASLTVRVEPSILTKCDASFSIFPAEVILIWNLGPDSSLATLSLEAVTPGCKILSQHLSYQKSLLGFLSFFWNHIFYRIYFVPFDKLFS